MNFKKIIEFVFALSKEIKDRLVYLGDDIVPVNYYTNHNNWGDQLNRYLIEKITNKKVVKNNLKFKKHILAIGSVLSSASEKSVVWGSGFISNNSPLRTKNIDIRAVRGILTQNRLVEEFSIERPTVLGDPAVLLPLFYEASQINKKNRIGIIPHYKDKNLPIVKRLIEKGCILVDIQDDIEPFIDRLNECEYILSSSLHGLIAADSYNIPNKWVSFSNMVLGGQFKFLDYYSTTTNDSPSALILNENDNPSLEELIDLCVCNEFKMDKRVLLDVFPKEFI